MTRRSLEPGTQIARYRVVSLLGAGGMGEVYLARDESLDRSVALKVLPPDLVKNDERVRRFVQEAKSASSLNHPHIVTIYEIGEVEIRGSDGAPAASTGSGQGERIQFIAMELVSGHTLKTLIHQEKTDLKTLVRYLAQAADGLAKAHAAGIVHRDLKPENIMVTSDGFAKVVDFGLAKLTETATSGTDLTSAPTALAKATGAGMVLGTVGYMSPEQVQGKTVDHRSDIFSLGCVLYEAATRQRPFQADSDIETLHKILKDRPQPIEEINPEVPGELRRIVRRCLAKAPEQRAQGMKDLALELAELADEYDTLSASSGSGSRVSSGVLGAAPPIRRTRALVVGSVAVATLAVAALAWNAWGRRAPAATTAAAPAVRTSRVLSSPNLEDVLLSPDGRQLVYTRRDRNGQSLWTHQIATDTDVQLLPPRADAMRLLRFSADGNYIFFAAAAGVDRSAFFQLPAVGGVPLRKSSTIDTDPHTVQTYGTLSPDGRLFASMWAPLEAGQRGGNRTVLRVLDLDTGQERTLTTLPPTQSFSGPLTWSRDGTVLATAVRDRAVSEMRIVVVATADGHATTIGASWKDALNVSGWVGDGRGLVVRTRDAGQTGPRMWFVSYPDGEVTHLSDADFESVTTSADGQMLAATETRRAEGLWVSAAGNLHEAQELRAGVSADVSVSSPAATDTAVFVSRRTTSGTAIWTTDHDGANGRRLTPESMGGFVPMVAQRAGLVVFRGTQGRGGVMQAWRMTPDGGDQRRLTGDANLRELPQAVSPDGATVLLVRSPASGADDFSTIWRVPASGGEPQVFLKEDGAVMTLHYSPDGRWLLVGIVERGSTLKTLKVIPATGGATVKTWEAPDGVSWLNAKWAPSGDAIDFVKGEPPAPRNLWRQPLGGGSERQLTAFQEGGLEQFAWSPDGRRLFFIQRSVVSRDVVLITNFRPGGRTP